MKIYAYLAALTMVIGLLYGAYHAGQVAERDRVSAAVIAQQAREAQLVAQIDAATKKREVELRDRIKVVKDAKDNCLDTRLPEPILNSLRNELSP